MRKLKRRKRHLAFCGIHYPCLQVLASSLFEKLDPDFMFSGLEDSLAGFGDGAVVAVVIDDQGVVEEEFGAVVGVEVCTPVWAMST